MTKKTMAFVLPDAEAMKITDAVKADGSVKQQWKKLAQGLYSAGIRFEMLVKLSKAEMKESGIEDKDKALHDQINDRIVSGFKGREQPDDLLHVTTDPEVLVRASQDFAKKSFDAEQKRARRYWNMQIGSYFKKIRDHIEKIQYPKQKEDSAPRTTRTEKEIVQDLLAEAIERVEKSESADWNPVEIIKYAKLALAATK